MAKPHTGGQVAPPADHESYWIGEKSVAFMNTDCVRRTIGPLASDAVRAVLQAESARNVAQLRAAAARLGCAMM